MELPSESPKDLVMKVPLFPLPNVILFPGAILPLHIFEERYKAMTTDALAGDRRLAMALLRPGWEKDYYCRPAIEPVVCIGKIARWERLDEGTYNLLLHGETRARILDERPPSPYRMARLQPLTETTVSEPDLAEKRCRLTRMFESGRIASLPLAEQIRKFLNSSMPTPMVADLVAFHALSHVQLKQSLLAETDVMRRIERVIAALDAALPILELACRGETESGRYN
jgi:Lon protease-like protein